MIRNAGRGVESRIDERQRNSGYRQLSPTDLVALYMI
jgi:hypothetical protein